MTITREDVADLQPGDVVEMTASDVVETPTTVRGRLTAYRNHGSLGLTLGAGLVLRRTDGEPSGFWSEGGWRLTVVSRAPRPLYVNHPRTELVVGDVVQDASGVRPHHFVYSPTEQWVGAPWLYFQDGRSIREMPRRMPDRLRLLVDGETGQVVQ